MCTEVAGSRTTDRPARVRWGVRIALALLALLVPVTGHAQSPLPTLPLVVHVAQQNGTPIVDAAWVAAQVDAANHLYAPHDVAFQLEQVVPLTQPAIAELRSRDDRDSLGAA